MDILGSIISDISSNLETLKKESLNLANNNKKKIKNNSIEVENLNNKIIEIESQIKKYQRDLNKCNQNYEKIKDHIGGIESMSDGYTLFNPGQIENIKNDTLQKKHEITNEIKIKIANAKNSLALAHDKINLLNAENKSINDNIPGLKSEYFKKVNDVKTTLGALNKDIVSYCEELVKANEDLNKNLIKVYIKKEIKSQEEINKNTETVIETKEQVKESKEQVKKSKEQIKKEKTESVKESKLKPEIEVIENTTVVDKNIIKPVLDYSLNEYSGIKQMNLAQSQINKLVNNMSSEKFAQIINILKKYDIPLEDVSPFYNQFINIGEVENLEETLDILKGLGKNNNEKDFSYMLDIIFESNNLVLQDNLLTVYAKGNNPADISIYSITSINFNDFDEQVKIFKADGNYILKKYPVSSMLLPFSTLVEFDKQKNAKSNKEED